jgi:hypothetical protein
MQRIEDRPPDADELREFLQNKLEEADKKYNNGDLLGAKQIWDGIISLYTNNREMAPQVERAQSRLSKTKEL